MIALLLVFMFTLSYTWTTDAPSVTAPILIDPGHGGEDGGAVADDGTLEKNINLAISINLRDVLLVCGYDVMMTRDTDVSIHDASATTIRDKKHSDMRNRLSHYEKSAVILSIHQNRFSIPKYKGAQVFYSKGSEGLAKSIQTSIVTHLQPDNNRQVKPATDGIFLLYHTTRPAVLVECGFLSNPQECADLNKHPYRQQLALSILEGYVRSIHKEGGDYVSQSKDRV